MNHIRQQVVTKPKVNSYSKVTFAKLVKLVYGIRVSKKYTAVLFFMFTMLLGMAQTTPTRSLIVNLNLLSSTGATAPADGIRNDYSERFSNAIDQFDNIKLINMHETFGTMRGNTFLATERRGVIGAADTVYFRFLKSIERLYQLEITPVNFAGAGYSMILYDAALDVLTYLPIDQTYYFNFAVTADPATKNPDRFRLYFRNLGIASGPLPVRFTGIQARRTNSSVSINWQVAEQLNVAQYQVERSLDGRQFQVIDRVAALTNGSQFQYSSVDQQAGAAVMYYRIRSVDLDGRTQLSDVVRVQPNKEQSVSMQVFPNPAPMSQLQVQLQLVQASPVQWRLLDANGRIVFQQQLQLQAGAQVLRPAVNGAIQAGLYQVQVWVAGQPTMQQTVMITGK